MILSKIQHDYPQIKELLPAGRHLEVPVKARHRRGAKANHKNCTMSRAVKELTGADDVYTTLSSVVVVKDGKAVQYGHGSGSRDIVTINDTRGEVVDQTVWLNAPNQTQRILSLLREHKAGVSKATIEEFASEGAARINELRNSGYDITSIRGCDKKVRYVLTKEPERPHAPRRQKSSVKRKYRSVEKSDPLRDRA